MTKLDPIPKFEDEAQERAFWQSHDSAPYVDWARARNTTLPNLRPTTRSISLRLPQDLLDQIKVEAHKRDVPYQSLIKTWLADRVDELLRQRVDA